MWRTPKGNSVVNQRFERLGVPHIPTSVLWQLPFRYFDLFKKNSSPTFEADPQHLNLTATKRCGGSVFNLWNDFFLEVECIKLLALVVLVI